MTVDYTLYTVYIYVYMYLSSYFAQPPPATVHIGSMITQLYTLSPVAAAAVIHTLTLVSHVAAAAVIHNISSRC